MCELHSIFDMCEENCGCAFNRISGVNHTLPAKYIWPETMEAVTPLPHPILLRGSGFKSNCYVTCSVVEILEHTACSEFSVFMGLYHLSQLHEPRTSDLVCRECVKVYPQASMCVQVCQIYLQSLRNITIFKLEPQGHYYYKFLR